jgi:hypothetical protein
MGYNPHANVCELFDFETTQLLLWEKILTTSGKKITSIPYSNGDTLLSAA